MKNMFEKNDIAIDLTSLLDVIFIVLLIVMCGQKTVSDNAVQKATEYEAKIEESQLAIQEAKQEKQLFEEHSSKYEETGNYVLFIDVSAKAGGSDGTDVLSNRKVMVLSGVSDTGEEIFSKDITPENDSQRYGELLEYLDSVISEYDKENETKRPVILTLNRDDDEILYRDERAIEAVFEELKGKYEFVY